jgi:FkbM family methyltransferase
MRHDLKWTTPSLFRNQILERYEPIQPYIFAAFTRKLKAKLFFDIGANIGAYTVFISSLDSVEKTYSFEPDKSARSELVKNIKLNNLSEKVVVYDAAVSDTSSVKVFGVFDGMSGINGILETTIHDQSKFRTQVAVNTVTLDELTHPKGQSIALKIDVEGHEPNVVLGAANLIKNNICILQIESYSSTDNPPLKGLVHDLGLKEVIQVGPDLYLSNSDTILSDGAVLGILQEAMTEMVRDSVAAPFQDNALSARQLVSALAKKAIRRVTRHASAC